MSMIIHIINDNYNNNSITSNIPVALILISVYLLLY